MIGKSTGIALLMAAALLAALFAMGVFSASGVGAHTPEEGDTDTTNPHDRVPTDEGYVAPHDELAAAAGITIDVDDGDTTAGAPTVAATGESWTGSTPLAAGVFTYDQDTHSYDLDVEREWDALYLTVLGDGGASEDEVTVMVDGTMVRAAQLGLPTPLALDTTTAGAVAYKVDLTDGVVGEITVTVDDEDNGDSGPRTYTIALDHDKATDNTTPGSNQSLVLESTIDHDNTDNIIVKLSSFGVPSSIDTDDVRISLTGGAAASGFPSDVEVDGTTVTLVGPVVNANGETVGAADHTGATITFRRGAGITLPIRHNDYDIKVESEDVANDGVQNWVTVRREVSVKPSSGKRGTEVTISGKGFADGSADLYIASSATGLVADANVFGTVDPINVADGVFSIKLDTAAQVDSVDVFNGKDTRKTYISLSDSTGMNPGEPAEFTMTPSFTVSPDNPLSGADITITLKDVSPMMTGTGDDATAIAPKVAFAGSAPIDAVDDKDTGSNKDATWKVTVPSGVRIGTIQLKVTNVDYDKPLTQNITIGTNDLTITPTTVVPRQEISIDGGGFSSTDVSGTDAKENAVLKDTVEFGSPEILGTHAEQPVNNAGNISFNLRVPDKVKPGSVKVTVKDGAGRVGVATITIAKPAITLDPAESLVGSQVTVSGTGFPANDLVLIKYATNTVTTAATTSTGTFEQTITVPSGKNPGASSDVEAVAQVQEVDAMDKASAKAKHTLPKAAISLSPDEATAGSNLTITGANYNGFRQISLIEVGGQNVTPVPAPSSDRWGAFTATVQVPQLTPGRYAVLARIGEDDNIVSTATEFLQVVTATMAPVTNPADVFADLSDRLVRVWYLDRETQTWSFYDPDPEVAAFNTLSSVTSGQIVTIIISEGDSVEFHGQTLFTGSNPISLN